MTKIAFLILVLCSAIVSLPKNRTLSEFRILDFRYPSQHCRISITSVPTPLSGFADDNPYWDEETQSVYFGDVFGQLLFRYSYKENRTYSTTATGIQNPAFFMPIANRLNRYLVGVNGSGVILNWNGRSSSSSIEGIAFTAPNGQWLNSASTTANGDLYIGTYSAALCTADPIFPFYRYSQSSGLVELSNGFKSLVGSALIEKTNTMKENSVLVQVGCTGNLCNTSFHTSPLVFFRENKCFAITFLADKREVIHLNYSEDYFLPGLTADTNGDLYCGVFNGSRVIKINPR